MLRKYSRFGINLHSTVAEPVNGNSGRVLFAFNQLLQGETTSAGKDLFFTAIRNVPYANHWFTKYALDFLIVHNLKEAVRLASSSWFPLTLPVRAP